MLPENGAQSKTITLYPFLMFLGLSLFLGSLGFGYFGYSQSTSHKDLKNNYDDLLTSSKKAKSQIKDFSNSFVALESKLQKLKLLESKIRHLTSLNDPQRNLAIGPLEDNNQTAGTTGESESYRYFDELYSLGLMHKKSQILKSKFLDLGQKMALSEKYLSSQSELLLGLPSIWPVRGWVTSNFGFRTDPFMGRKVMHRGMDIAAPLGTSVLSPANGTVRQVGTNGSYGNFIIIDHNNGISTKYGHLHEVYVKRNHKIKRGQKIGIVGNTGRSTGPHLHYELMHHNIPIDPRKYILD